MPPIVALFLPRRDGKRQVLAKPKGSWDSTLHYVNDHGFKSLALDGLRVLGPIGPPLFEVCPCKHALGTERAHYASSAHKGLGKKFPYLA